MNKKCTKCGSSDTRIAAVGSKQSRGFLWFIFIGCWVWIYKWMIGALIFLGYDIWMFIIAKIQGRGYRWKSPQWFFATDRKYYHCNECGNDFRG